MRLLPLFLLAVLGLALALSAEGCNDRACFEWSPPQGPCPGQKDAIGFFGGCGSISAVKSGPSSEEDGTLCCYDVVSVGQGEPPECSSEPTTTVPTTTFTETSGGGSTFTSTPTFTTTTGEGGAPPCATCAEALSAGNAGTICAGNAEGDFAALSQCACTQENCADACNKFCSVGEAPNAGCNDCLGNECAPEAAACQAN